MMTWQTVFVTNVNTEVQRQALAQRNYYAGRTRNEACCLFYKTTTLMY